MHSFTIRKLLSILMIMVVAPLLSAARANPDTATNRISRPGISKTTMAMVHKKIALNYRRDADRLQGEANDFTELVESRRKSALTYEQGQLTSNQTTSVSQALAEQYAKMAQVTRDRAQMHEEMARSLSEEDRSAKGMPEQSAPCAGRKSVD